MKDYSEFIGEQHGFITSIKPNLESKTIEVMTSMSKKNQPHVYELNRENVQRLYGRLEKQYKLLIENKDSVLKQLETRREKKLKRVDYTSLGISAALILTAFFATELNLLFVVGLIPGVGTIASTMIARSKFKKDFESMIETYNYFINNKEEIEVLSAMDVNVTNNLTNKSYKEIDKSNALVESNVTDNKYTIGLIDSLSLKDLKEISLRYKISKSLDSEPYFYIEQPEEVIGEPVNDEITEKEIASAFDEEGIEISEDNNQSNAKTLHK